MNKQNQLTEIHESGKPYIVYKSQKGFDLYTDFSKKIILNNKNIKNFLNHTLNYYSVLSFFQVYKKYLLENLNFFVLEP